MGWDDGAIKKKSRQRKSKGQDRNLDKIKTRTTTKTKTKKKNTNTKQNKNKNEIKNKKKQEASTDTPHPSQDRDELLHRLGRGLPTIRDPRPDLDRPDGVVLLRRHEARRAVPPLRLLEQPIKRQLVALPVLLGVRHELLQ